MDEFACGLPEDRGAFIQEAAARMDLTPMIIEKDFWVCWTLRRLTRYSDLAGHVTFKGGTSLSKAYGIIKRFSEDIDLTIRRDAPGIADTKPPMEDGISSNERGRRIKALKEAGQTYVQAVALPALVQAIEQALGTKEGWSVEPDPEDPDKQTLLFHYPRVLTIEKTGTHKGYIKPRIKLEYGARGEPEPYETRTIRAYLADQFPGEFADANTDVETLSIERTFWEKITILHALHYNGKLKEGMSRHYYDVVMLDRAGITASALAAPDLLRRVVRNKSLMFAEKAASYDTAVLGTLRLLPNETVRNLFVHDYAAMEEMFMEQPPGAADLLGTLKALEQRINCVAEEPMPLDPLDDDGKR
jgi:predicted nucleotidyltransferase component of viral defense system